MILKLELLTQKIKEDEEEKTQPLTRSEIREVWNQGLVNLDFDDNKTRFKTNDYILSVIRQDDF